MPTLVVNETNTNLLVIDANAPTVIVGGGGGTGDVTQEELDTHAANTTSVHGISNTAVLKAVIIHNGTSYPSRPSGFTSVEWIGPDDPGGSAANGDTWIPTEAP